MKDETQRLIDQLQHASWFAKVQLPAVHEGEFIDDLRIETYRDAFELFNEQEFEELCAGMRRPITDQKNKDLTSRLTVDWNDFVTSIRPGIEALVENKLTRADAVPAEFLKPTRDGFNWQIVHAVCCVEFNEFSLPTFYKDWCDILIDGHFACYWDGDIEEGQFVVI